MGGSKFCWIRSNFDFQSITESLLINGINLFQDSYKSVLDTIDEKVSKLIKK